MFVACSTLCFGKYPLDQALRTIAELGFTKVDVAVREPGPHLRPSEVAADVQEALHKIRVGPGLAPAALSALIQADDAEEHDRQFRAVCRLARLAAVPVVTIPAAPAGTPLDAEAKRLAHLVQVAEQDGVLLAVSTDLGAVTEDPDAAVELCRRVPNLGLTFDPSTFIAGPHADKGHDQLFPFVRHVHLRDTGRGPDQFQVRVGQGEVEYGRIISHLGRFHYDRLLTVDIRDVPDAAFPMEPEVRKLKFLLESLV